MIQLTAIYPNGETQTKKVSHLRAWFLRRAIKRYNKDLILVFNY